MISVIMNGVMKPSMRSVLRSTLAGLITDFVFTVATTTNVETFTIPCADDGVFDCIIDWGDGSTSTITAYNDADLVHTYALAGDHTISISGSFPNMQFANTGDKLKVKSVSNFGVVGWANLITVFYGCSNMTSFTAGNTDTSAVTGMANMFRNCRGLLQLDVRAFDTSSVVGTNRMFDSCSSLVSLDVSGFDVSGSTNFNNMFRNCGDLVELDVSSFDTSASTTMVSMFQDCTDNIVGLDNFNIEALNNTNDLDNVLRGVELSTDKYDALLINLDAQAVFAGMTPNFGLSTYTAGSAAATARANLISSDGWTITDGGTA